MLKLSFYVPESHLESVKAAIFDSGAGAYGAYDQCCWQVLGEGQFRPLAGSHPFIGHTGQLEKVPEYKVEVICTDAVIKAVVSALVLAHPYEEPAYDICKTLSLEDL